MLVLPTGGMGIGVEASGSNFPFVQPSADIQGLLADLWLAYDTPTPALPLRVSYMSGFQEAFNDLPSAAQITIVDANDVVIFDSVDSTYYWKDWGTRLRIHEWLFPGLICRAVQHRAISNSLPTIPPPPWPEEIYPINGVLDERTSELMVQRLLLITVGNQTIAGNFVFTNSWNVDIEAAPYPEQLRNTTSLTFNANAGDGPGRAPGCESPEVVVRTIDGVGPDERGNFTLAAGACYSARQPVTITGATSVPTAATLTISNDCNPCCDCDDYVNVQKAILNLEAELRATAALAESVRDEYVAASLRWNEQKVCRETQLLQLSITPVGTKYVDIIAMMCNATDTCAMDSTLTVSFGSDQGSWTVVPGTTKLTQNGKLVPYKASGPPPGPLTANIDSIQPLAHTKFIFRIAFNGSGGTQFLSHAIWVQSIPPTGPINQHVSALAFLFQPE